MLWACPLDMEVEMLGAQDEIEFDSTGIQPITLQDDPKCKSTFILYP